MLLANSLSPKSFLCSPQGPATDQSTSSQWSFRLLLRRNPLLHNDRGVQVDEVVKPVNDIRPSPPDLILLGRLEEVKVRVPIPDFLDHSLGRLAAAALSKVGQKVHEVVVCVQREVVLGVGVRRRNPHKRPVHSGASVDDGPKETQDGGGGLLEVLSDAGGERNETRDKDLARRVDREARVAESLDDRVGGLDHPVYQITGISLVGEIHNRVNNHGLASAKRVAMSQKGRREKENSNRERESQRRRSGAQES